MCGNVPACHSQLNHPRCGRSLDSRPTKHPAGDKLSEVSIENERESVLNSTQLLSLQTPAAPGAENTPFQPSGGGEHADGLAEHTQFPEDIFASASRAGAALSVGDGYVALELHSDVWTTQQRCRGGHVGPSCQVCVCDRETERMRERARARECVWSREAFMSCVFERE